MVVRRACLLIGASVLAVASLVLAVDGGAVEARSRTTADGPVVARRAGASGDPSQAPVLVHTSSGTVVVRGVPGSTVRVTTFVGGVRGIRKQDVVGADGTARLFVGSHDGRSGGLHPGDVVRVETDGARRELRVALAGYLDEVTGVFTLWTVPHAEVTLRVYTRGGRAELAGEVQGFADGRGRMRVDLASSVEAPRASAGSPWRGYAADVFAETAPGQVLSRVIQTTNATIVGTIGQVSASYLHPGASATFELRRAGAIAERLAAVADGAGLAQADLVTDIEPGDVLTVRWSSPWGAPRSLVLSPFSLTAEVDLSAGTIRGQAPPGAKVVAIYDAPGGERRGKATTGPDGRFHVVLPGLTGDRRVILWRVSDPGATGVGVDRLHLHTPALRVDVARRAISGWAQHGRQRVSVELWRDATKVESRPTTTELPGRFQTRLRTPLLPGDEVRAVSASGRVLTALALQRPVVLAGTAQAPRGTGEPGRAVEITTAACSATAVVGADSRWQMALPCGVPGQLAQVRQVLRAGASVGSSTSAFLPLP